MCGFGCLLGEYCDSKTQVQKLQSIQHRGPDETITKTADKCVMVFHRLAVMDRSEKGRQPMTVKGATIVYNGEIYNWTQLRDEFKLPMQSHCDTEVILHLFHMFGMEQTINLLDGVFAFVLIFENAVYVARDKFGVRPLFYSLTPKGAGFASELKALLGLPSLHVFPCGMLLSFKWNEIDNKQMGFHSLQQKSFFRIHPYLSLCLQPNLETIRQTLTDAVRKREHADRPIGALLSGGLDSSLITCLVNKYKDSSQPLRTFSVGMEGGTDLKYARIVADFLKTDHHEVILSEQNFIDAIREVIKCLESYDVTTVRASTGMYLVSKYISEKTDIKVLFSGEGSDEVCSGYMYFHNAPSVEVGDVEGTRLLQDLLYFDVLRADRTTANFGLELRVPFLDPCFVKAYLDIDAKYRLPNKNQIEKYWLRKAFEGYIPDAVLWRKKEAFSDGVSRQERSWFSIIQERAAVEIKDSAFAQRSEIYPHNTPKTKEAFWFRSIFEEMYPCCAHVIPYQWLPKWNKVDVDDPSARVLEVYDKQQQEQQVPEESEQQQ